MDRIIENEKELKESYEKIWKNSDLKEEPGYYHWILELLNVQKNQKLLDVACGGGWLLYEGEVKDLECYGIDISKNAIAKARKLNKRSELILSSSESIPFKKNRFDYITCLGSLEHFLNPEKSLKEMSIVLKDSGKVCIVLPNIWFISDVLYGWFTGEGLSHGQEKERFFSLNEAKNLIEKQYLFKIDHITKYNRPPEIINIAKPLPIFNKLYILLYKLLRNKIPASASYVFVLICTKRYKDAPPCIIIGNKDNEKYIGQGWHITENGPLPIRWTEKKATAYLRNDYNYKTLNIKFFTLVELEVNIYINNNLLAKIKSQKDGWQIFENEINNSGLLELEIYLDRTWIPDDLIKNGDTRGLGIAINKIWLE